MMMMMMMVLVALLENPYQIQEMSWIKDGLDEFNNFANQELSMKYM